METHKTYPLTKEQYLENKKIFSTLIGTKAHLLPEEHLCHILMHTNTDPFKAFSPISSSKKIEHLSKQPRWHVYWSLDQAIYRLHSKLANAVNESYAKFRGKEIDYSKIPVLDFNSTKELTISLIARLEGLTSLIKGR